jgi:hypothetical protein
VSSLRFSGLYRRRVPEMFGDESTPSKVMITIWATHRIGPRLPADMVREIGSLAEVVPVFPVLTVPALRAYELRHRSSPSSGQARPASRTCKPLNA